MKEGAYHHGNLREALIEAGIGLISTSGLETFSVRGVAAACGVSPSALYSHFKDIEDLRMAMGGHVADKFLEKLEAAVRDCESPRVALDRLGHAYIDFFGENPNYFVFLFYYSNYEINLDTGENNYKPFALFQQVASDFFDSIGLPQALRTKTFITLWVMVHGTAAMLTNKDIKYTGSWNEVFDHMEFMMSGGVGK